ncbi:MAG: membrane protein insertion efficiency factor YidD [Clostridia bacterium]|nr:membrane protein insertion efficiency factor YidD [Clostridia bacterium]MCI9275113.1 membrane protein insertion efficiency factor YidD [Clostridia bacterium]
MRKFCIYIIEKYQKHISPILGKNCKYYPTCSEYAKQAVMKYGVIKGCLYSIKRIIRCNPFSKGGYDPLK